MGISFWQIAVVVVLVVLLFGRGKISDLMGDVAKGINSFKKGMKEGEGNDDDEDDPKVIEHGADVSMAADSEKDKENAG